MKDYNFSEMNEMQIIGAVEETYTEIYNKLSELESQLDKLHTELFNDNNEVRIGIHILKKEYELDQSRIDAMMVHYYSLKAKIQALSMAKTAIYFADR